MNYSLSRRTACTLAVAGAFASVLPMTADARPTVSFRAPSSNGTTVSGVIPHGSRCEVTGSGIARVDFTVNSTAIGTEREAPWQCGFDTRRFPNGTYTLRATAYDAAGASTTTARSIIIQNGSTSATPAPAPSPAPAPVSGGSSTVAAADVLGWASGDVPFAQQSGYSGQVLGKYPVANTIPEGGIHGPLMPNGETIRLGKTIDPTNSARKALVFQLHPGDPNTSGSKRAEITFPKNIEMGKTYWVAFKVYLRDWGSLSSTDHSIFGTQLHSGDNSKGYSPSFSLVTKGGRTFFIDVRGTGLGGGALRYGERSIPFGRWVDFVFKVRQSTGSDGLLQGWMDGEQIVNHSGPIGYKTSYNDYFKFGYYNWSKGFNSSRKVLLRSPTIVRDPTGSKYTPSALRAHINR